MDIACPHCAATYRVPESLVAGGKALRCAACAQEWVPQLPSQENAAVAAAIERHVGAPAGGPVREARAEAPAPPAIDLPDAGRRAPPQAPPLGTADPPPLMPRREPGQRVADEGPRVPLLLPAAWIVSIAAIALGLAALYLYRGPLAAAWPPLGRLF